MEFYNTWQELDEIYKTNFLQVQNNNFYHFYSELTDLINSLVNGRMYSNKNARASQLDVYAHSTEADIEKNYAYVCMTTGTEGKTRAIKHLKRPLGLSFKDLEEFCKDRNYEFNPQKEYSQFAEKTQYDLTTTGKKNQPTGSSTDKLINAFRDFRILAMGELGGKYKGTYFISGGQGRNLTNHWHSKLITDSALYSVLRDWFVANMQSDYAQAYYHFKNNTIGNPIESEGHIYVDAKGKKRAINTDQQLNKNYIPWVDKSSNGKDLTTHEVAMAFELKRGEDIIFEEIIGVGPLLVEDDEGRVLLKMDMVKPGSKGGYQAPYIFSSLSNDGSFADATKISYGKTYKGRQQQNLILDQKTTSAICDLYSESEYRVYIPKKRDLVFKAKDIESIVLPNYFLGADFELNIELLVEILCKGKYKLPSDKTGVIEQLQNDFILNSGENLNDSSYELIKGLIDLLQGEYQHTVVEILQVTADKNLKVKIPKVTTYQRDNSKIDSLPKPGKNNKFTGSDKTRYVVDIDDSKVNINVAYPRLNEATVVPWNGIPSVIAPIKISGVEQSARLGAETIVVGKDSNNKKYVLFVNNAHKTDNFFELPGGGLYELPRDDSAFEKIARHRLHFKGGITGEDLRDCQLRDTRQALLLHEKGVAKDDGVVWQWSYYRLFKAYYDKLIDEADIDYHFNNEHLERVQGEDGYTCYLRWIPVDTIQYNKYIVTRYSNIINQIKAEADKF